jgi:Uma2 family endonuclease
MNYDPTIKFVCFYPDYCFYIDNWLAVLGKDRIDWQNDPPPDLVIELDVTSYSSVMDYLPYKVPEIWLWKNDSSRSINYRVKNTFCRSAAALRPRSI